MSYADMAAKGPKQTDEEKMPDSLPEIEHSDSGVQSLDSLSSSNNSVPSFADQQKAAEDRADETQRAAKQTADDVSAEAKDFGKKADAEGQRLEKDAEKTYDQAKDSAKQNYDQAKDSASKNYDEFKKEAGPKYEQAKDAASKHYKDFKKEAGKDYEKSKEEGKKAEEWADKNKGNPVVIGNVVVVGALGALLGTGAYRMQKAGTLTWKVAGAWAGVVGLFAVGDYYVSQYFFKKYPPKQ